MSEPLKFCKDCAHVEVIDGTHLCACDERVSLVTGEKHQQRTSCTIERATEVAGCGAEGRWWKAKSLPLPTMTAEEFAEFSRLTPPTAEDWANTKMRRNAYRSEVTQREEPEPTICHIYTTSRGFRLISRMGEILFEHDMFSEVFAWAQENNYHIANPS